MPALTGKLHKLVFGGILAGTETWACSIHLAQPDQEVVDADAMLQAARGPVEAYFESNEVLWNGTARLNWLKLNEVDKVTGKYVDQGTSHTYFEAPMVSPHAWNGSAPPQLATAVTWHTDRERGRASKGRIYLPTTLHVNNVNVIDTTGHITLGVATLMAVHSRLLMDGLSTALTPLRPVVWSQIGQEARIIERVSVGRLIDTQLRRRKSLTEDRFFDPALVTAP